jgi:hypothetical protein
MSSAIVEFRAPGTARAIAAAIEAFARERRVVGALVVPWESDAVTLRMAVTSTSGDGWAIEHTNLGTISLVDLDGESSRVVVMASELTASADPDTGGRARELAALTAFARQIERKFAAAPAAGERAQ